MSDPSELDRLKLERAAKEEEDAKPAGVAIESDQQRRGFALTATPLLLHLINLVGTGESMLDIYFVAVRIPSLTPFRLLWGGEGRVAEKSLASPPLPSSDVQQVHSLSQRETEKEEGGMYVRPEIGKLKPPAPLVASRIRREHHR